MKKFARESSWAEQRKSSGEAEAADTENGAPMCVGERRGQKELRLVFLLVRRRAHI